MSKKTVASNNEVKFKLHKEELEIYKKWIQTGEVNIYKEVISEEKIITVPVTREELVIEKKTEELGEMNRTGKQEGTIRIPISEERIEIIKHPTILEEVEIYTRQFEEIIKVQEDLKEEKLIIDSIGDIRLTHMDHLRPK